MTEMDEQQASLAIIEDEHGYLLLGDTGEIGPWLESQGVASRPVSPKALSMLSKGVELAADASSQSGRWVKLTKESSELVAKYGKVGKQSGVLRGESGKIIKHLDFYNPGAALNPSMMAGVGGVMAQYAIDQAIEEITDYLKSIDSKLDELVQDQKDQAVAKLRGTALAIEEARAIHDSVGSVNDVTWSKVAGCAREVASVQSYALQKLDNFVKKLEGEADSKDLLDLAGKSPREVSEWLQIMAWAVREQDELSVIELGRVMEMDSSQVLDHRKGVLVAREKRLHRIDACVCALEAQLEGVAGRIRGDRFKLLTEIPLFERESDRAIAALRLSSSQLSSFASAMQIEATAHEIASAPRWNAVAGEVVDDVSGNVRRLGAGAASAVADGAEALADGAQELGDQVRAGAEDLGEKTSDAVRRAGEGAAEMLAVGADGVGKLLGGIKLPFGGK